MLADDYSVVNAFGTTIGGVSAFLAALVAAAGIFKEQIHQYIFPVRVHVEWKPDEPFLGVYKSNQDDPAWERSYHNQRFEIHLRLLLTNLSRTDARNVQVFIQCCEKKNGELWEKVPKFVPIRLLWSHVNSPVIPLMTAETQQLCDFGVWSQRKDNERGITVVPDELGRHFVMASEVKHKGSFFGPEDWMRRAAAEGEPCRAEYRFQMVVASEGGVIYKACWHLEIYEYDERVSRIPEITLNECKVYQNSQAKLPW